MHPIVFVAAGLAVPLVRYLFKSARNASDMWTDLVKATGGKREFRDGHPVLALPSGVTFALYERTGPKQFRVEGPSDIPGLPPFLISRFSGGPDDVGRDQQLLQPELVCSGASSDELNTLLPLALRRRLATLSRDWRLRHRDGSMTIDWLVHGLSASVVPASTLILGIRRMEELVTLGDTLLLPLDEVEGVAREGGHRVLPDGARLAPRWWRGGLAVNVSVDAGGVSAEPFSIEWKAGKREGPYQHIDAPAFEFARVRLEEDRLHLTAPLSEPEAVVEHAAYLQRLARALRTGSSPFR